MFKLKCMKVGYQIQFEDGHGINAKNNTEAINALQHYVGEKHNSKKCPSCDYSNKFAGFNYFNYI